MGRHKPRLTSIAITARRGGGYRVAVFPRNSADMSTMPQDYENRGEADTYASKLSARTGWHVVDRAREQGLE